MDSPTQISVLHAARRYWVDEARHAGRLAATRALLAALWEFLRDSAPSRLRQRYGDAGYDWDHGVNTTSAAVGWRDRLLGTFHSAYQPTDEPSFREMLETLRQQANLDFCDYTFLDLGSGKGRTLLMASDYPFRRIVGVELLPSLNQIAGENLHRYENDAQRCFAIESLCADATAFPLPDEPLVIYLFHPLPESGLRRVVANLEQSLRTNPRPVYVLYYNPLLDHVLLESAMLRRIGRTHLYSMFAGPGSGCVILESSSSPQKLF
jgi:SAM-dependent methyltransferase